MNTVRRLILVRHAKSDRDHLGPDHARPLNARGRRDARALGRHLAHQRAIDRVLCSSAVRACETWDLVVAGLDPAPPVDVRDDLYLAAPAVVLAGLRTTPDALRTVAVIGHEPTQSALVDELCGTAAPDAAAALANGFATSAVAVIEVDVAWSTLARHCGRLLSFDVPRG